MDSNSLLNSTNQGVKQESDNTLQKEDSFTATKKTHLLMNLKGRKNIERGRLKNTEKNPNSK